MTIIRDALALTEQDHPAHGTSGTPKAPPTPDMGPQRLPASDIWWPPLKTCSKLFTLRPTPPPNRSCNLMAVEAGMVSTSGWYASYWNAFLCTVRPRYVTQMSIPFVYVAFLPPATKLGQGNIFRSVCQQFCPRGGHVWLPGGHAWFYSGGHAWFYSGGAWFYSGGMHGFIQWGGMCGFIQRGV